ncbi:hypothetical protein ABPG74_006617, partial [Tetrahymena malaccensis]
AKVIKFSFINNQISSEAQLVSLNNLYQIELDQIKIKLNKLDQNNYSSFIQITKCYNVTLTKCVFDNNINSYGYAGALYITETSYVQIYYSQFISNKCLSKNGGAIYFVNTQFLGTLILNFTSLIGNQAKLSTGGAISLKKTNLILQNSQIESNVAQIGGGIYYQQIIPDFILSLQNDINYNNTILNNYAYIYGRNIGSTLRKIQISKNDIIIEDSKNKINKDQNQLKVFGIQSGQQITFKNIQILDEEQNPVFIPPIKIQSILSEDVLLIIKSISIQIICDQEGLQIQCIGDLKSSDYQDKGFSLSIQFVSKPLSTILIKFQSNIFPQLIDSNNNILIKQNYLDLDIELNFDKCKLGSLQKKFNKFFVCEPCPEGKYSLDIFDDECKKCPEQAEYCLGSKIQLKDGYWRSNELTDDIIYCNFNPSVCQPQNKQSKLNCAKGYIGIICGSCDTYGQIWDDPYAEFFISKQCQNCQKNTNLIILNNLLKIFMTMSYIFFMVRNLQKQIYINILGHFVKKLGIIFLSKTYKSDMQKIYPKILNDHLQILSLICGLFSSFSAISVPVQIIGNPLGAMNKSIDCLLSKNASLRPLWFYQLLWSLLQPIIVICLYFIYSFIFLKLKKNFFIRHAKVALIFIYFYYFVSIISNLIKSMNCVQLGESKYMDLDFNIKCYDPQYHLIYMFTFCLPLLIFYTIIPIFLFKRVYDIKKGGKLFLHKIEYQFIYSGLRDKLCYWEFYKILYKFTLILVFVLYKESQIFQVLIINILMLAKFYLVVKLKPYNQQTYNELEQISIFLCIVTLNMLYIYEISTQQTMLQIITIFTVILTNLCLFLRLTCGMIIIQVNKRKQENNIIQNILLKLKQIYPNRFNNIQVVNNQKIKALLQLKAVQAKFKKLVLFLKKYKFYNQEQLLQQFNQENQFINLLSEQQERENISLAYLNRMSSRNNVEGIENNLKLISRQSQQMLKDNNTLIQQTVINLEMMSPQNNIFSQENFNILSDNDDETEKKIDQEIKY